MKFKTSDLDKKLNELNKVNHERTLREQIYFDENDLDVEHCDVDLMDDFELNVHIDYLINTRMSLFLGMEV